MCPERTLMIVAERVGFEPTIRLPVCRISSAVLSTTQPPLRFAGRALKRGRLIAVKNPGGKGIQGTSLATRVNDVSQSMNVGHPTADHARARQDWTILPLQEVSETESRSVKPANTVARTNGNNRVASRPPSRMTTTSSLMAAMPLSFGSNNMKMSC